MNYLPHIEITIHTSATKQANASVIWLHGLGASGHDFEPVVPHLNLPSDLAVRFIFPHAPQMPVTINNGYVMPAWYDILEAGLGRKVDTKQIEQSAARIIDLVEREIERGVPSKRIVLAGFSQGGAVAYEAALSYSKLLAGLLTLSTYFATHESIELHPNNKDIPILVCHGTLDPMVREQMGKDAVATLREMGYQPKYKTYPMEHQVNMDEIQDIGRWLEQVLT